MTRPNREILSKGRLEAFSDGVFAIALTIMVLELHFPEGAAEGDFLSAFLLPFAPKFLTYALSFLVIAIMWVNHHYLVATLKGSDRGLLWWNNILLFWVSLIPVATSFMDEHWSSPRAVAFYGIVLFGAGLSFTLLRIYALKGEKENAAIKALHQRVTVRSIAAAAIYGASVPLAYVSVYLSFACFIVVPAMFFLPDRLTGLGNE